MDFAFRSGADNVASEFERILVSMMKSVALYEASAEPLPSATIAVKILTFVKFIYIFLKNLLLFLSWVAQN